MQKELQFCSNAECCVRVCNDRDKLSSDYSKAIIRFGFSITFTTIKLLVIKLDSCNQVGFTALQEQFNTINMDFIQSITERLNRVLNLTLVESVIVVRYLGIL